MSRRRHTARSSGEATEQSAENSDSDEASFERVRIDIWLWRARLAASRTLAAQFVVSGYARLAGRRIEAAARLVGAGDVLTLTLPSGVRVIQLIAIGKRRGPVPEARALYADVGTRNLDPPEGSLVRDFGPG